MIKKIEKAKVDVEEKLADISDGEIEAVKEKMAKTEEKAEIMYQIYKKAIEADYDNN